MSCHLNDYDTEKVNNGGDDDTGKSLLVCVNIGEHVDPGVDRSEVEMALVLNHHPQQALHLVARLGI